MQTETHVCTIESRVYVLHATMQQSVSMCAEHGQRVQQFQQECETIRTNFHDLTTKVAFSFGQVKDALTQLESESQTLRDMGLTHVFMQSHNLRPMIGQQNTQHNWKNSASTNGKFA